MASFVGETPSSNRGPLGPFRHTSALLPNPNNPLLGLASHTLRETWGATVQLTADGLQSYGEPCTFRQLVNHIQSKTPAPAKKLGISVGCLPSDKASVRAALLVLLQHSIVHARLEGTEKKPVYRYIYEPERACWILRYSRYIELSKKAIDETAACVVETLLLNGRFRTVDLVLAVCEREDLPKSDRYTDRQTVIDSLLKLVSGGLIEMAPGMKRLDDGEDAEFEEPARKKVKIEGNGAEFVDEDPAVVSLLTKNARYKTDLPIDAAWRVNMVSMHDNLRAHCIGRLVGEVVGHKVQSAGSLVAAALKYQAHVKHVVAPANQLDLMASDLYSFDPQDTIKYLPKSITQDMEKKVGGVKRSLAIAWEELAKINDPLIVRQQNGRYEVATSVLVRFLRERAVHQLILDRHDQISARIISILSKQGWLQSDHLASLAMLPSKDAREKLHHLYRNKYVELFQLSNSRQHNTAATIYMWTVNPLQLNRQVMENVAQALWHMRLRRQHQVQVGNMFIERAHGDVDENEIETDKLNYQRFCLGLERLDCAVLQLDETLMMLKDF